MTSVRLKFPAGPRRRWQEALIARLTADGARVSVELGAPAARAAGLDALESLERTLFARGGGGFAEAIGDHAAGEPGQDSCDFVLDFTGAEPAPGAAAPLFDGSPGDDARDAALLEGRAPVIQIAEAAEGGVRVLAEGRPAYERKWLYCDGLDAVCGRLVLLAREAVRRRLRAAPAGEPLAPSRRAGRLPTFLARALAFRVRSRIARLAGSDHHWRIGLRRCSAGDGVMDRLAWPDRPWTWLADDRRRYYADPVLFEHEGATWLFCEEYPYASGRGVISVARVGADGSAETPRVALERPYHLSYPLVFRHEGAIWMMPETSAAGTLELYRSVEFPYRWELDRTLIEGAPLADATFFKHDGRHWLTATTCEDGSSWDCLSLFVGPGPLGPWTRCGDAPALIDAAAARPAGPAQRIGGQLWRPAQDCVAGYGAGLALCRVDRLDETGFAQTVVTRLPPPPDAPQAGVHTLSRSAGFEAIDALDAWNPWRGEA